MTPVEAELTAREGRPVRQVRDFGELTTPGQVIWGVCTCGQKHRMMLSELDRDLNGWLVFDDPARCPKLHVARRFVPEARFVVHRTDIDAGAIYRVVDDLSAPPEEADARPRQREKART